MSKKSKLSFSIKKSLIVGAVGATTLASTLGCTEEVIVNPAPDYNDEANRYEEDAGDAGDADGGEEDDAGEESDSGDSGE